MVRAVARIHTYFYTVIVRGKSEVRATREKIRTTVRLTVEVAFGADLFKVYPTIESRTKRDSNRHVLRYEDGIVVRIKNKRVAVLIRCIRPYVLPTVVVGLEGV